MLWLTISPPRRETLGSIPIQHQQRFHDIYGCHLRKDIVFSCNLQQKQLPVVICLHGHSRTHSVAIACRILLVLAMWLLSLLYHISIYICICCCNCKLVANLRAGPVGRISYNLYFDCKLVRLMLHYIADLNETRAVYFDAIAKHGILKLYQYPKSVLSQS